MRRSDAVDLLLELVPRRWAQALVFALIAVMAVTGWYEPVLWYVYDKAAGLAETWLPAIEELGRPAATTPVSP